MNSDSYNWYTLAVYNIINVQVVQQAQSVPRAQWDLLGQLVQVVQVAQWDHWGLFLPAREDQEE